MALLRDKHVFFSLTVNLFDVQRCHGEKTERDAEQLFAVVQMLLFYTLSSQLDIRWLHTCTSL